MFRGTVSWHSLSVPTTRLCEALLRSSAAGAVQFLLRFGTAKVVPAEIWRFACKDVASD